MQELLEELSNGGAKLTIPQTLGIPPRIKGKEITPLQALNELEIASRENLLAEKDCISAVLAEIDGGDGNIKAEDLFLSACEQEADAMAIKDAITCALLN